MATLESKSRNFWPERIVAALVILIVTGSMAFAAIRSQQNTKHSIDNTFTVHSTSAASFLESNVKYTLQREQELAKLRLGDPQVSHDEFLDFLDNLGFGPSVLLDENGKIIDIAPYKAELIGKNILEENDHLRRAVINREQTVSNVVPSDALKFPNVAFATPFQSQSGVRIISGAFDLTTKPLGDYFENMLPEDNTQAFLIDQNQQIIASDTNQTGVLSEIAPKLVSELNNRKDQDRLTGHYTNKYGRSSFYATRKVNNTPWTVVTTIEDRSLYKSETGMKLLLPWLFLSCFTAVAIALVIMLVRQREKRIRLQDVSLIDLLTGVFNTRGIKSHLTRLLSLSRRHKTDLSVFKIDLDNFTSFNEKYGHNVGDDILRSVSNQIHSRLRTEDIVGRSGGGEFIVVLPNTDVKGASIVAERIRRGVEEDVRSTLREEARITVSIGIASAKEDDSPETITERSEQALKDSKSQGKNKVTSASSPE
ncbi:MAG: sensor domain-containing diguanylate cyclase [Acidimicrobiia bacterium]